MTDVMIKEWQPQAGMPATEEMDATQNDTFADELFESACPLCGQNNDCAVVDDEQSAQDCWCMDLEERIPSELLDKVPPELQGERCICANCIQRFREGSMP